MRTHMISISREAIHRCAIAYIALPTLIFLFSWLRPCLGIPIGLMTVVALVRVLMSKGGGGKLESLMPSGEKVSVPMPVGVLFAGLLLGWCILAGQGGFVPQAGDWNWRNALFRDLITHEWPVVYPKYDRALVFYLGHWLPSAVLAKVFWAAGLPEDAVWSVGKMLLLLWTYFGVLVVFMQMLLLLRPVRAVTMLAVMSVFLFGDGLDLIGHTIMNVKDWVQAGSCGSLTLGTWFWAGEGFILAHHGALLTCVFHQIVVPWMAVLLLADECQSSHAAFLLSLVLICGPLPSIGIAIIALFLVVKAVVSRIGEIGALACDLFSFENMVGVFAVCPVVAAYLTASPQSGVFGFAWNGKSAVAFFGKYVLFVFVEVGIYLAVAWRRNRQNIWWYATLVVMLICPLVTLGEGPDFSMRVSVPAMLVLLMMVVDTSFSCWRDKKHLALVLWALLVIGMVAPFTNMKIIFDRLKVLGFGGGTCDAIVTFDRDTTNIGGEFSRYRDVTMNCCRIGPSACIFYKWMARRNGVMSAKKIDDSGEN